MKKALSSILATTLLLTFLFSITNVSAQAATHSNVSAQAATHSNVSSNSSTCGFWYIIASGYSTDGGGNQIYAYLYGDYDIHYNFCGLMSATATIYVKPHNGGGTLCANLFNQWFWQIDSHCASFPSGGLYGNWGGVSTNSDSLSYGRTEGHEYGTLYDAWTPLVFG